MIKLLFLTGLRRGELLALQWSHIKKITVCQAVRRIDKGQEINNTTKGKKDRVIPLSTELETLLRSLPLESLFVVQKNGSPLTIDQFQHRYHKFFDGIGAEYKSAYKCRHSFASHLIKNGEDIRTVRLLLGHAQTATTQIYTHLDFDGLKNNISKLTYAKEDTKEKAKDS